MTDYVFDFVNGSFSYNFNCKETMTCNISKFYKYMEKFDIALIFYANEWKKAIEEDKKTEKSIDELIDSICEEKAFCFVSTKKVQKAFLQEIKESDAGETEFIYEYFCDVVKQLMDYFNYMYRNEEFYEKDTMLHSLYRMLVIECEYLLIFAEKIVMF